MRCLVGMYACHLSNLVRAPDKVPLSRLNARPSLRSQLYNTNTTNTKISSFQFSPSSDETLVTVELEGHAERAEQSMAESEKMHVLDLLGPEILEKGLKMDNWCIIVIPAVVLIGLRDSERVMAIVCLPGNL